MSGDGRDPRPEPPPWEQTENFVSQPTVVVKGDANENLQQVQEGTEGRGSEILPSMSPGVHAGVAQKPPIDARATDQGPGAILRGGVPAEGSDSSLAVQDLWFGESPDASSRLQQAPRGGMDVPPVPSSPPQGRTNGQAGAHFTALDRGRLVGKLTLLTDEDALKSRHRDYYLKGLISPAEMSVFYGEPGCGKSFLALYIARAIAQGRPIFGKRIHQTPVLFLALEGVAGFENRLKAQIITTEHAEKFSYIAQPVDLFNDRAARESVIEAAQLVEAGLIVIDTLNRAMGSGSENDPADMGQFIKNIDAIRAATGCHIMIIHHSGKDAARGMRGHSSLLGAADVVVEVTKGTPRKAEVMKAKDDRDGDKLTFDLDVQELGTDQDADPITSCTVSENLAQNPFATDPPKLKPQERQWLDQLFELFQQDAEIELRVPMRGMDKMQRCATRKTISRWIRARGLIGVADSVAENQPLNNTDRSTMSRVLNNLRDQKKIGIHGEYIWLVQD